MIKPEIFFHWVGGGIAAFLLLTVIMRLIETFQTDNQQRSVTGIAIVSGLMISIGVSPFGTFAEELAYLFEIIPKQYPEWVKALLTLETIFGLLYGVGVMAESGGWPAIFSFVLAFFGGLLLPYSPPASGLLMIISWSLMEVSPADKW